MSKYGEVHDIFNTHHVETKAKLDTLLGHNDGVEGKLDVVEASNQSILTKNTEIDSAVDAMSAKITACNTADVTVSACALPTDGSKESKQDTGNASIASVDGKITACDTGSVVVSSCVLPTGASLSSKQDEIKTLITATNSALAGTLSVSAPAISKSSSTPINAVSVALSATHLSSELDLATTKHISIFGSSDDTINSHEVDLLVSNVSGGTFFPTSHSGYFMEGFYHAVVSDIPYRYVKIQVINANMSESATFTIHLAESN
tara:strand:- start:1308 stop:2093 length:786 start_codon:yes stop_codon:yes gene_type:complete